MTFTLQKIIFWSVKNTKFYFDPVMSILALKNILLLCLTFNIQHCTGEYAVLRIKDKSLYKWLRNFSLQSQILSLGPYEKHCTAKLAPGPRFGHLWIRKRCRKVVEPENTTIAWRANQIYYVTTCLDSSCTIRKVQ